MKPSWIVLGLAACGHPSPPPAGVTNTAPTTTTLAARLAAEVGQGEAVAILPGATLRAVSADGVRSRVLVDAPASWALVDPRARVVWFGNADRTKLMALDLETTAPTPQPIEVVRDLPDATPTGSFEFSVKYQPGDQPAAGEGLTFGHPARPHIALVVSETPTIDLEPGVLEAWPDEEAAVQKQLGAARLVGADLVRTVWRRGAKRPLVAPFTPQLSRVEVDGDECEDAGMCGTAESLPRSALVRVVVSYSCGDGCYTGQRLYDPATKQFLDADWADSFSDVRMESTGEALVRDARVVRFDSGWLAVTPEVDAQGGGWLEPAYYIGL